jgi:tRNA dimethylallyltransferase
MQRDPSRARIIVVAGPTASGKSALALALARALDGVVINADSMQVYRELRVLTARPSEADEAAAPHRLYGMMSVRERCSAGHWRRLALAEIAAAEAAGRGAILVGGTGLYLKTLLEGIAPVPAIPETLRAEVCALHAALGPQAFHARLAELDPEAARRLSPADRQRTTRAYEVVAATGRTLASFHAAHRAEPELAATVILLMPPGEILAARIAARCAAMLRDGAVAEARALVVMALDPALPALKAVGVRELTATPPTDECGDAAALDALVLATRRYAKRQRTWFRHQLGADLTMNAQFSESLMPEIIRFIRDRR